MGSKIITLSSTAKELEGRIRCEYSSNGTSANSSSVTACMEVRKISGWGTTTGTWTGNLKIHNDDRSISWYGSVSQSWVTVKSFTVNVPHNADGTGACAISGRVNGPGSTTLSGKYVSGSGSLTLDKIPRWAAITSAPNFNDEQNPAIQYSNPAGTAITRLEACIASPDGQQILAPYRAISKTGSAYTFSLSAAERDTIRSYCRSAKSRQIEFALLSEIGGQVEYSVIYRTVEIINADPSITINAWDTNPKTAELTGDSKNIIILKESNVRATLSPSAKKGASIVDYGISIGNGWQKQTDITFNGIPRSYVSFFAKDSRGNIAEKTIRFNSVIEYTTPSCSLTAAPLLTEGGSMNCEIIISGDFFNGSFGAKHNTAKVFYQVKSYGGSWSNAVQISNPSIVGSGYTAKKLVTGLDPQISYVFRAYIVDELNTRYSGEFTISSTPLFDTNGKDFNFNVPLSIKHEEIKDFVIEVGASGPWTWRKWDSGAVEFFLHTTFNSSPYANDNIAGKAHVKRMDLPFPVVEYRGIGCSVRCGTGLGVIMGTWIESNHTLRFYFSSNYSADVNCELFAVVHARYK